jgi:hypothetical protein
MRWAVGFMPRSIYPHCPVKRRLKIISYMLLLFPFITIHNMPLTTPSLAGKSVHWSLFMPLVKTINKFFSSKRTCFLFRREPIPAVAAAVVVVGIRGSGVIGPVIPHLGTWWRCCCCGCGGSTSTSNKRRPAWEKFLSYWRHTYSMDQSASWEANWFSGTQEIPHIL